MKSIIHKKKVNMILMKNIHAGPLGDIECADSMLRIGFLKLVSQLIITPILHRNVNRFMGMRDTSVYICYKVIKDKMFALTDNGEIWCWDICTAKLLSKNQFDQFVYTDEYSVIS